MLGKTESMPQVLGAKGGAMQAPLSRFWVAPLSPKQILTVLEAKESYYCILLTSLFYLLLFMHVELMFGTGLVPACNCSAVREITSSLLLQVLQLLEAMLPFILD